MEKTFINYMYGSFYQIGFVTKDLDRSISFFEKTMGVPKFLKLENPPIENQTFNGAPIDISVNLAFGQMGNTNIELIQPVEGHSTYDKFLEKYDWMGMHHLAVKVFDFDTTINDFKEQGLNVVQTGEIGEGSKFAYIDTVDGFGHYTEVLFFDPEYDKLFDKIKRGDI